MARMLRHTPTGDLYIYTDALAKRKDMTLVEEQAPEVVEEQPKEKSQRGKRGKKLEDAEAVIEELAELVAEEPTDEDE